mmetsp:Transcript_35411/g.117354  ORF Transcript_35411/g.117354 Transcript_35411/m.117354 type:complete len:235 (+) Transcript_35411:510-1214(+)
MALRAVPRCAGLPTGWDTCRHPRPGDERLLVGGRELLRAGRRAGRRRRPPARWRSLPLPEDLGVPLPAGDLGEVLLGGGTRREAALHCEPGGGSARAHELAHGRGSDKARSRGRLPARGEAGDAVATAERAERRVAARLLLEGAQARAVEELAAALRTKGELARERARAVAREGEAAARRCRHAPDRREADCACARPTAAPRLAGVRRQRLARGRLPARRAAGAGANPCRCGGG